MQHCYVTCTLTGILYLVSNGCIQPDKQIYVARMGACITPSGPIRLVDSDPVQILTDRTCPNLGCPVPLLRSPVTNEHRCVNCDQMPASGSSSATNSSGPSTSQASAVSTAPTEISSIPDSPTFELPPETEESRLRREQSDRASTQIGKLLLQGWTILGEECSNSRCIGVPLMSPPKTHTNAGTMVRESYISFMTY
jgi:uncharacterized Zn finger protein (UPF0148 family)